MGITSAALGLPSASPASATEVTEFTVPMPELRKPAALLQVSQSMKDALIAEEGVRDVVYRDVAGHPTVGVGHLVRPEDGLRVGQKVSQDQILQFLEEDLRVAEGAAARVVGDLPLFQHEFDAVVDLVFNVGEGNLSSGRSPHLNQAIANRDYDSIAKELHYTHAAGVEAKGLVYRSERRSRIFMNASYEDPRGQA
jgi:GH24 family phage-related lysozyme (muramidase)